MTYYSSRGEEKGLLKSEIYEKHIWMDLYLFRLIWITDDSVYTIIYFQTGRGRLL